MTTLIEWLVDEVFTALAMAIYREFGRVGCVVALVAPLTMLALVVWLIVR